MVGLSDRRDGVWKRRLWVELNRNPFFSTVQVAGTTKDTDHQSEKTERQTDN